MYLQVEDYDRAEEKALMTAPNRIVACCMPVTFVHVSYPIRITSAEAATRYVDVMHDTRSALNFSELGGITPEELAVLKRVAEKVATLTENLYGRRQVPRSGLLRALQIARHFRYVFPTPGATIFEAGAGSAYLGAILLELGYRYVCMDITQAFYIWQNHLMNAMADGDVAELATSDETIPQAIASRRAVHLPWWKFMTADPDMTARLDGASCNHAFCEMHPHASTYLLGQLHSMFEGRDTHALIFEGWGTTVRRPIWHIGREFANAQLQFAHNDTGASVLVRKDSPNAEHGMELPHTVQGEADGEQLYHPHIYTSEMNPISRTITEGRAETAQHATVTFEEFDDMLRSVLGRDELLTDDERFLRMVQLNAAPAPKAPSPAPAPAGGRLRSLFRR